MNSFGKIFRINIYGESHGKNVGIIVDGCPAGISIDENDFWADLSRRKSGTEGTTSRTESDLPSIVSGVFNGFSTGAPIMISFENKDVSSGTYVDYQINPRPGHADFAASIKFNNFNDFRGSGHFSGRLTVALVAAGVIAKKIISPAQISSQIQSVGGQSDIDNAVKNAIKQNDTVGGIIECRVTNIPVGLGEPFFDSVESVISHLIFSIPGIKAIEFGSGFESAEMFGSEYNDSFIDIYGKTRTNNSGGITGGITNSNDIVFRVAVRPPSSIPKLQETINLKTGQLESISIKGRHDTCFALRLPPVIEAVTAIALADLMMMDRAINQRI